MISSSPNSDLSLPGDLCQGLACGYSVRKLRQEYTGDCMRIRRSSDGAETDIGFSGNFLDTGAISSFVGANDATVTTWYDQSATGENAVNTDPNTQPTIVSSGNIVTENAIPALQFIGTTGLNNGQFLRILNPTYFDNNYTYTVFVVFSWTTSTSSDLVFFVNWTNSGNSNGNGLIVNNSSGIFFFGRNAADSFIGVNSPNAGPGHYLATGIFNRGVGYLKGNLNRRAYMGQNNDYLFTPTTTRGAMLGARFNFSAAGPVDSNFMQGTIHEVLIWPDSLDGFAGYIRDNMDNYYF